MPRLPLASCLLMAACATPLDRPLTPYTSRVIEVAPGAPYEKCVPLQTGDRLLFSYQADPPMSFGILRRVGDATLSYILRDASREDSGIFFVAAAENYCLHWDPVATDTIWPTLLRFTIQLNQATDKP
ncbi:MAG: hypothetical protein ABI831_05030 [Betaproteobacteria bacterium]